VFCSSSGSQVGYHNWLKELAKDIPEAKWEINCIHNDPYPSALSTEETPGLNKIKKLTNNHLHQTAQGPQDTTSTMAQFQCSSKAVQHSFSPNLIRKVQDWRDWTNTDGGLKKHEEGQDIGSSVYHPCLNISHYVNPRGVGITNTISRAELAAIAATIIHGYSHIATDSLTSRQQIKKQLSHPNLHRHHIQGDVLQSIAKAIHQSPSPIHFHKVKSHAVIISNEYADALARKPITTYSDVADTSIKTTGPEGNPLYNIDWLAKEYEEHQIIQNHPNTAQSPS
jgi:ribonuclease HI